MHGKQRTLKRLEKVERMPLPESLERAFSEIERPMVRFSDSTPERTESIAAAPRTAHNAR